jgi:hypothetical protein
MPREHARFTPRSARTLLLTMLLCFAVLALFVGCHKKDNVVNPIDQPPTGDWTLVLHNKPAMVRDTLTGRVHNDTITVRLYDTLGALTGSIEIDCRCMMDPTGLNPTVYSRADTSTHPWGSDPVLMYYGRGDTTGSDAPEVVNCWALRRHQNTIDTLAHATTSFYVQ